VAAVRGWQAPGGAEGRVTLDFRLAGSYKRALEDVATGGEGVEWPVTTLTPTRAPLASPLSDMWVSVTSRKTSAGAWSRFVMPTAWIRARLSRGLSLSSLGPNEARLLFDAGAATGGLAAALLFLAIFIPGSISRRDTAPLLASPILFITWNVLAGLYTRLKLVTWQRKAAVLLGTVALTSVSCLVLGAPPAGVLLWALVVAAPVILARAFVALPFTRHAAAVTTLVAHRHGPVVVLGGAGYIGCHTVDLLLKQGYEVRVLDRLMYGRLPIAEFIGHPRFELIEGDVTDLTKLTSAARNASAVIHLAGLVGDPACAVDPDFTRHTNIVATRMAKDVAQSLGVQRFVFASSCSVYGVSDAEVDELSAPNPMSLYAQTKLDSERELLHVVRDNFFVTVLRFATVFGHSRRPRFDLVANLFTAQAMTEGRITVIGPRQWRPFIHVRDLARAIVRVLESSPHLVQSQIYNVGDGRMNMTIGQVGELVAEITRESCGQVTVTVQEEAAQDRRNYGVSFEKIRRHLGFEAETGLADGIREMARQFADGSYRDFRDEVYNNVATARRAVERFYDPLESQRLYGPLRVGSAP
jgi:nucleoside-diphosphate-sugar epimerase